MKRGSKIFLLSLVVLFLNEISYAKISFTPNCKEAYLDIFNLKVERARTYIELERIKNPQNKMVYYIENYIDFFEILLSKDQINYDSLINETKNRIDIIKEEQPSDWKNYILSELHLHMAVVHLFKENYFKVALNFYRSYHYITENIEKYPDFKLNNKISGFYNIVFGLVPSDFSWIAKLFNIKGNLNKGLAELKAYIINAKKEPVFKTEGIIIELIIDSWFKKDDIYNNEYLAKINPHLDNNSLVRFMVSWMFLKKGKNDLIQPILFSKQSPNDELEILYYDYVKGLSKLYNNNIEALNYFTEYLGNYNREFLKNSTRNKLSWYYFVNDDLEMYEKTRREILSNQNNMLESDKQAFHEAKNRMNYNKTLLKSRIFFDGGNYVKTIDLLKGNSSDFKEFNEKIEYHYRLARSYQKTNDFKNSIEYFSFVINHGEKLNEYYTAFSYYNLGFVYAADLNYEKAKQCFNKCFEISGKSYNYSLEIKTKIALYKLSKEINQ